MKDRSGDTDGIIAFLCARMRPLDRRRQLIEERMAERRRRKRGGGGKMLEEEQDYDDDDVIYRRDMQSDRASDARNANEMMLHSAKL